MIGFARLEQPSAHRFQNQVAGFEVAVRAVLSKRRDRSDHQSRKALLQVGIVQSQLIGPAWREGFYQDVSLLEQAIEDRTTRRFRDVERHALLVNIEEER